MLFPYVFWIVQYNRMNLKERHNSKMHTVIGSNKLQTTVTTDREYHITE